MSDSWFDDIPVLGNRTTPEVEEYLRSVGDDETADAVSAVSATRGAMFSADWSLFGRVPAWKHTTHSYGFIPLTGGGAELLPLRHAGNIDPDLSLRNSRIRITLDRLRVAEYPGRGVHRVLVDFSAQHAVPHGVEQLHFNATYRVLEGEQAAVTGYPVFVGLAVASEGVAFRCYTVNVQNDDDEAFLGFLESNVFRSGLRLAVSAQPAIAPLSEMAYSITRSVAKRNRNVPVQEFYLGLDFSRTAAGARLAEGSYVVVQLPESLGAIWDWREWVYDPQRGTIVEAANPSRTIPYNYIVFSVTRHTDE